MLNVIIAHIMESDEGTLGSFSIPEKEFVCYSLELPWRDNKQSYSRIPTGEYIARKFKSPTFGNVYMLENVKDRSYILIHIGNWAGDRTKGYKTNSHGCILLGKKAVKMLNQLAVTNSRSTFTKFMNVMEDEEEFKLKVI